MAEPSNDETHSETPGEEERRFGIQRVYLKDVSFETPNSPDIFSGAEWKPEINLQLQSESRGVGEKSYEVVLTVTVTAKVGDQTAYLVEVQQGGLFEMAGFGRDDMTYMMGSYCPTILFPFAREMVSNLVTKGGFPQLLLSPVNFDALLAQQLEQAKGTAPSQTTQ